MSVKFDVAKCPVCRGPLEPAYEYGHTILRCPYCGFYTYVTVGEGGKFASSVPIVVPKWTTHARQSLNIIRQEIKQAYKYLIKKKIDEAYNRLVWIKDTLSHVPHEARDLPIFNKLGKSISQAEGYYMYGNIKEFSNELRDLYKTYIKTAKL